MRSFFKAFFTTLIVVMMLFLCVVAFYIYKTSNESESDKLDSNNFQFLLLGVDSLDQKEAESTRSDTIMIVNMNLNNGNVNLISIPRDTYAKMRGYNKQKINHSYNYGGSKFTLETVNNLLGTNIKYYMTMDYEFVEDVVDKIGGVRVNVPIDMKYEDPTAKPPLSIDIKSGDQVLNGNQAIGFLRYRKGYKDADLGRVKAQQEFMKALLSQMKTPKTIFKIPLLFSSYVNYTDNNIPFSIITKVGIASRKVSTDNIESTTLPGVPKYIKKVSYFIIDEESTDILLERMGFK